jgi:glycosyltransferase involved in cell wall biosynthesis
MRILYVATAAEFGGVSRHILWLAESLVERGHEVGFVIAPEQRLVAEAKELGVEVFPNPYFVRRVRLLNDLRSLWPVYRAVRRFNPDLVSAHSTKAGYAARLACTLLRKPVIFTAHGWAFTEGRAMWRRRLLALVERLGARGTAKLICVSEHDRKLAEAFRIAPPRKLVVIRNGVPAEPFMLATGAVVRDELRLGEVPVLTMVGRLSPPKDAQTVIAAIRHLGQKVKLVIVGDGEQRETIQKEISKQGLEDCVLLTGERNDIPEILAATDIFILSSFWEGLPRSIIEAMMAGLPVVASRVGGVPELVQEGENGFLFAPGDAESCAEKIQRLLNDTGLRERMGRVSRQKALQEFSLDRMLEETRRVYEAVLERAL